MIHNKSIHKQRRCSRPVIDTASLKFWGILDGSARGTIIHDFRLKLISSWECYVAPCFRLGNIYQYLSKLMVQPTYTLWISISRWLLSQIPNPALRGIIYFPTLPSAKPNSFAPDFLPCLLVICSQFDTARNRKIKTFNMAMAAKNCQIFGIVLLPLIWDKFMP